MVPPIGPNQYIKTGIPESRLYSVVGNEDISYKNTLNALVYLFEQHPYLAEEGILVTVDSGSGIVARGTYVIKPESVANEGDELELKVYKQGEDTPTDINVDVLFGDGITNVTAGRKRMNGLIASLAGIEENGLRGEVLDLGKLYHDYSASIAARSEDDRIAFVLQRVSVHTDECYRNKYNEDFILLAISADGGGCTEAEEGLPLCGATIEGILDEVGNRYELTAERQAYRSAAEEADRAYASAISEGTGWREAYEAAQVTLDEYQVFKDAYQFVETLVQTERAKAVRKELPDLDYNDLIDIANGSAAAAVMSVFGSVTFGGEDYNIDRAYSGANLKAMIDGDDALKLQFGQLLRDKLAAGDSITVTDEVRPYLALALNPNERVILANFDGAYHTYLILEDGGAWNAVNDSEVVIAEESGAFSVKPKKPFARKHVAEVRVVPEAPASSAVATTTTGSSTLPIASAPVSTDFHAFEGLIKRHGLNGSGTTLFNDLFDDGLATVEGVNVDLTDGINSEEWTALKLGTQEAFALWSVGGDASKVKNGNVVGDGNVTAQDQNDMNARTIGLVAGGVGVNPAELKDIEAQYLASTEWLVVDYEEATARLLNGAEFINANELLANVRPSLQPYVERVIMNISGTGTIAADDKLFIPQLNKLFASMVFLMQVEDPGNVLGIESDPMGVKLETGSVNELMEALFGNEFIANRGLIKREATPSSTATAAAPIDDLGAGVDVETVSSDYEALESAQAYLQNKEYDEAIAVLKQADITNSDVNGTLMQAYTLAYLYYVGTSMSGATRDDINLVKAYRIYQEARALNPEHENVTMMADGEQGVIGMRQYVLEGESDATQVSFLEALTAYRRLASISAGGYDKVYSQEATDQAARTEQLTKLQSKIGEYEAARKQVAQIYYDLSGDAKVTVLSAFEEVEFAIFASYAGICQEHSNYTLLLEYYFGISMSVTDKGLSFLSTAVMSEYFQRNSDGTKGRAVWSQFNEMGFNVAIFRGAFDKLQADVTALEGRDDRRAERNKINEILNGGNGTIGIRMVLFQYYSDTRQTDEARAIIADLPDEQRTQMEEQLKAKRNVDSGRSRANDLGDAVRDNRRSGGRSSGGSRGGARPGVVENK